MAGRGEIGRILMGWAFTPRGNERVGCYNKPTCKTRGL